MSYMIVNKCVFIRVFLIFIIYENSFLCGIYRDGEGIECK